MTRDELLTRTIYIEATPRMDRAKPIKIRTRGSNIIPDQGNHPSEDFEDFFDYEKEMLELTPARNTVVADIEHMSPAINSVNFPPVISEQKEDFEEINTGFVVMTKKEAQTIDKNDNIESDNVDSKTLFEFFQCEFSKENGERCKKQAKKGQKYCATHRKFLEKNT